MKVRPPCKELNGLQSLLISPGASSWDSLLPLNLGLWCRSEGMIPALCCRGIELLPSCKVRLEHMEDWSALQTSAHPRGGNSDSRAYPSNTRTDEKSSSTPSFNKDSLSNYYMPNSVLDSSNTSEQKQTKFLCGRSFR